MEGESFAGSQISTDAKGFQAAALRYSIGMDQRDFVPVVKSLFLTIHRLSVESATLHGLLQKRGLCPYQEFQALHRKISESRENAQIRNAVANLNADSDVTEILACI